MRSCAEMGSLRNNNAPSKGDFSLGVEDDSICAATFVPDFQIPRGQIFHTEIDVDAAPQLRTKEAKQKSTPRVEWKRNSLMERVPP